MSCKCCTATTPADTASPSKDRHGENFPVGSWLIRKDLRRHVHAFYTFARTADDISDNPALTPEDKIARLDRFAAALEEPHDDTIPCVTALRNSLAETGTSPRHSLDLLTAFKRDAMQSRYRDWADLLDYCRYSAAPVGRHVLALHGIGESAWLANDALCAVLQIINHMQDCGKDYAVMDRVYIPLDMLAARGGQVEDLALPAAPPPLRDTLLDMVTAMQPMLDRAKLLPTLIDDWRLSAETAVIYALAVELVRVLQQRDPLCEDVHLGKLATARIGIGAVARLWLS